MRWICLQTSPHREAIFRRTYDRVLRFLLADEIVDAVFCCFTTRPAEHSWPTPKLNHDGRTHIRRVHALGAGGYNHGWTGNFCMRQIHEIDPDPHSVVAVCDDDFWVWAEAFDEALNLAQTEQLLVRPFKLGSAVDVYDVRPDRTRLAPRISPPLVGGIYVTRLDLFARLGGLPEIFVGWGAFDNLMAAIIDRQKFRTCSLPYTAEHEDHEHQVSRSEGPEHSLTTFNNYLCYYAEQNLDKFCQFHQHRDLVDTKGLADSLIDRRTGRTEHIYHPRSTLPSRKFCSAYTQDLRNVFSSALLDMYEQGEI